MAGIAVPSTRGGGRLLPSDQKTTQLGSAATSMPQLTGQAIASRRNLNSLKVASMKAGARPGTIAPQYQARAERQAAMSGGSIGGGGGLGGALGSLLGGAGGGGGLPSLQMEALGGGASGASGAGAGGAQGATSYNPAEMSISAQSNPQLEALSGELGSYRANLAKGSDQDAVLALQRQRDFTSGLAKEYGANSASRGIYGSGAEQDAIMKRIVEPGQAQMSELNAQLASDARAKQLGALGQQAQLSNQNAQLTQADKNFALQSWVARDQANRAQADLALRQQQIQSGQGMQLASLLAGMYTGF